MYVQIIPGMFLYIASYNAIVYVHSVDNTTNTAVIGTPCNFYDDAQTSVARTRVDVDILDRMASIPVVGVNIEHYIVGGSSTLRTMKLGELHTRSRFYDDRSNNRGLYHGHVRLANNNRYPSYEIGSIRLTGGSIIV